MGLAPPLIVARRLGELPSLSFRLYCTSAAVVLRNGAILQRRGEARLALEAYQPLGADQPLRLVHEVGRALVLVAVVRDCQTSRQLHSTGGLPAARARLPPGLVGASSGTTPRLASAPTACGPAFAPARRRALQGQGLGARGPTPRHQSSRRCRYPSYGCRIPTEASTTGESRFRDRARVDGHQFAPSPRPAETRLLLQILRRGFGIPLLDEPLEDLVHVYHFERTDGNDDPGVLRDII